MRRIFIIVPLLVVLLLFGSVQQSFANKVTKTVNVGESYSYRESPDSHKFYETDSNAHIISTVWSYDFSFWSDGKGYFRIYGDSAYNLPTTYYLVGSSSGIYDSENSHVRITPHGDHQSFDVSSIYLKNLTASAKAFLGYGDVTLNSVVIDIFTVDSVNVSNTEDGYVKITVTQSSPDSRLSYKVINNNDGRIIATKSGITTSSFTIYDMAPIKGSVNEYRVEYGFSYGTPKVSSNSVYVPIDKKIYDAVNNNYGNTIDAVRDSSGTVLQAARDTKNTVNNGYNNNGKSLSATYDKANSASGDANYIRNTQLPGLENKIANLETTINNNFSNDTMSPIVKLQTVSGARATSASSIPCIVSVTDNSAGPFEYRVNDGSWDALPFNGQVSLPVTRAGMNTITVEVQDPAGNIGRNAITIRKL